MSNPDGTSAYENQLAAEMKEKLYPEEIPEERAEDPALLLHDGSADHISRMRLNDQQPKQKDHDVYYSNIIEQLMSENLRLSNELKASEMARMAQQVEARHNIQLLNDEITNQKLLVIASQEGRKAEVQKLKNKLERLSQTGKL